MIFKQGYLKLFARLAAIILVFVFVARSGVPIDASTMQQDYPSFFDSALTQQLADEHIAGAVAAVVKNGEIVFAKGYGYADMESGVPAQPDHSLFFIGSNGKLFTWTAVMQLAEQGKLDLHADVNTYLDFKIPTTFEQPVTLHHLMTHTAGFEDEFNSLMVSSQSQVLPLGEHLRRFMPARVYPPGSVMAYSNYGTALAGYIVERVSGQPFDEYLAIHILQPLGMQRAFVGNTIPDALAPSLALGYRYQGESFKVSGVEWTAASPCAPLRLAATDLAQFMIAHLNSGCTQTGCILGRASVEQMHALQFTHHPQMDGMAYGFMRTHINGETVLWHLGNSPTFISMIMLLPDHNLGVTVTYNSPPADDGRSMMVRFMDQYFPVNRAPLDLPTLPGWQDRAQIFNGNYAPARSNHSCEQILVRYTQTVPVKISDGRLVFNGWQFVETEPGLFKQVNGDRTLVFRQDETGKKWMFINILAYFQVPWYQTPVFLMAVVGGNLVLIACFLLALLLRRKSPQKPGGWGSALLAGLSVYNIALMVWAAAGLVGHSGTYIYPQSSMNLISTLYWVSIPWTIALLAYGINAWSHKAWTLPWRLAVTTITASQILFLILVQQLNFY